jgi:spermidine/putrescine transport system ATP-binding protein
VENPIVELKGVVKKFEDGVAVVDNIDLKINRNEFVTLLGPSGCGKTTTLRMIGGFEKPDSGLIIVNGKVVNDLPPYARPINTVFQRYALFPHLNVAKNIAFGLKNKGRKYRLNFFGEEKLLNEYKAELTEKLSAKIDVKILKKYIKHNKCEIEKEDLINYEQDKTVSSKMINVIEAYKNAELAKINQIKPSYFLLNRLVNKKIDQEVDRVLKLVKLSGFKNRRITAMSGGQMQRVAIARALINKPEILLLDEPLAALDLKLRQNMQYELKEMQRKLGITFIFVTHDQEEAMTMSDQIVVMKDGKIVQSGRPIDIYNEPANRYVANFIGESNIIRGTYVAENKVEVMGSVLDSVGYHFEINEPVDVVIRPEDFDVVPLEKAKLTGVVTSSIFKGVYYEICANVHNREFVIHAYENVEVGTKIGLSVDPYEIFVMKADDQNE